MKGDTAQVVAAGVLPVDGGYKKVTALRKYLQDLNAPSKNPQPAASAGGVTH